MESIGKSTKECRPQVDVDEAFARFHQGGVRSPDGRVSQFAQQAAVYRALPVAVPPCVGVDPDDTQAQQAGNRGGVAHMRNVTAGAHAGTRNDRAVSDLVVTATLLRRTAYNRKERLTPGSDCLCWSSLQGWQDNRFTLDAFAKEPRSDSSPSNLACPPT
jgi:hypothetical protein